MRNIRVVMIGNSLSGDTFVDGQSNGFPPQFASLAPEFGFNVLEFPRKSGNASPSDNLTALMALRDDPPDVICFQGSFEQCGGTHATGFEAPPSATQQTVSLNATYTYKQVIKLAQIDDPTEIEWIQLLATNGSRVRRGVFGTRPKAWSVANTTWTRNADTTDWDAGLDLWKAYLYEIAKYVTQRSDGRWPILLFFDKWFGGPTNYATQMRAMIDGWGFPNVGFVPFTKPDGTQIVADTVNCVGPTATIETITEGVGDPPALEIVCAGTKGARHISPGQYVALWDVSVSNPPVLPASFEFVKVATVDSDLTNTITIESAGRQQLGSAAALEVADPEGEPPVAGLEAGDVIAALNIQSIRGAIDDLGLQAYLSAAYDGHPINEGYHWMARSTLTELARVVEQLK